jgi:hypothetical protein
MTATDTTLAQPGDDEHNNQEQEPTYSLRRLDRVTFEIPIRGVTPLIVNRWSEKAKQLMLEAQQTKARPKKDPKDPVANFEASRYRFPDGRDGFPATAFKASIVHAARLFDGITQVLLKQSIIVLGETVGQEQLVPLAYGAVTMREDTPRNANGVADLRYRAQFWPWSATLYVRTIGGQFDEDSVLALVDAAGSGGVGEWRPTAPKSATGTYGCFEVVSQ